MYVVLLALPLPVTFNRGDRSGVHPNKMVGSLSCSQKHTQSMTDDATNHLSAPTTENWFWKLKSNGVRNCKSVTRFYC